MQNPVLPDEIRALLNSAFKTGQALGRKFERTDMTIALRQAAVAYAATYQCRPSNDDFMRDMQALASSGNFLSDGQAKGVLNVLMADARRRLADRKPVQGTSTAAPAHIYLKDVPDGRYRVTLEDGNSIAIFINLAGKDSKLANSRIVSTRSGGDDWMGVGHIAPDGDFRLWRSAQGELRQRVSAAINVLDAAKTQDEWLVAGLAFAQEGSVCFYCGRALDTRESLTAGYGPVCADKLGLPWGAKAIPMSVRLAQATAAKDPETGTEESADELLDLVEETRPAAAPSAATDRLTAERARRYAEIFGED